MRFKIQDDGSLKAVGQKAEKAGKNLERTAKGAHNTDRQLKGAAQASSGATKNFSKMSQGISGGLVPAYATLAATMFAVTAVFRGLEQAFNWKAQTEGLAMFAETSGIAMQSLVKDMRAATGGLLNFKEAAAAAQIGLASGLSPDDLKGLAEGAKLVSGALGRDLEDSFNRLVRGVTKAEPELLDELGIVLRLDIATRKYAAANGLLQNQLTLTQRMQAVNTEVQGQLNDKFGEFADRAEELMNPFTKLQTAFTDLVKSMSEMMLPPLVAIAEFLSENTEAAALLMAGFAASIMRSAFPALTTLSASMIQFGKNSKKSAAMANREYKKSSKAYKMAKDDMSAKDVVHRSKFKKILTKMGIDHKVWLKKSVVNQERSIAMMLRNEHKKGAKVKLLAKGELAYLRTIHGQIAASHANMTAKIIAGSNAAAAGMTAAMATAGAASAGILTGLGTLATKLAPTFAFLGTAMGWLFGVATAVFIGKFIWDWVAGTGVFDKKANALDDTWESVLGKLREIDTIIESQVNNIDNALRGTQDYNDALVKQANIWSNLAKIDQLKRGLGGSAGGYDPNNEAQAEVEGFFAQYLGAGIQADHSKIEQIIRDIMKGARGQLRGRQEVGAGEDFGGRQGDEALIKQLMGTDFGEDGDTSAFETFLKRAVPLLMRNKGLTMDFGETLVSLGDTAEVKAGKGIKRLRTELESLLNIQQRLTDKFKPTQQQQYFQAISGVIAEGMNTNAADPDYSLVAELKKAGIVPESLGLTKDTGTTEGIQLLKSTERVLKLSDSLTKSLGIRVAKHKRLAEIAGKLGDSHGKQAANQQKILSFTAQSETLMAQILEKEIMSGSLKGTALENAQLDIQNDMIKLENMGYQIEMLKEQDELMTAIRDKAIQAFDSAGQSQLKDLITGKNKSGTSAIAGIATSTLDAMSGVLAEKMMAPITGKFKDLLGIEDPQQKQERIFQNHVTKMREALEEHIKGIHGTSVDAEGNIITDAVGGGIEDITNVLGKKGKGGFFDNMLNLFSEGFGGGNWMNSIFSLFGFGAKGGMVRRYAGGTGPAGAQYVPGTGNRDTVPAMLTPGEIVIPKGKRVGGNYSTTVNVNMEGGGDVTTDDEMGAAFGQAIQVAVTEEIAKQQLPGGLLSPFGGA